MEQPLTIVIGYHDFLLRRYQTTLNKIDTPEEREAILSHIILKDFESSHFSLSSVHKHKPRILNLTTVTVYMERMLQRFMTENIELTTVLAADLGPVEADPHEIEEILMLGTIFARDRMPQGGQCIIETANIEMSHHSPSPGQFPPGSYVRLTIRDTGSGIAPDIQERMLKPFVTTGIYDEATLGWATIHGIVKNSQGFLEIVNSISGGTIVNFYFPKLADQMAAEPETIVLIDNDRSFQDFIRQLLPVNEFNVLEPMTGEAVLQRCTQHHGRIQLFLLTSLVMTDGMSSHDLATHLVSLRPDAKITYGSDKPEHRNLGCH